jgi:hypothetical protein
MPIKLKKKGEWDDWTWVCRVSRYPFLGKPRIQSFWLTSSSFFQLYSDIHIVFGRGNTNLSSQIIHQPGLASSCFVNEFHIILSIDPSCCVRQDSYQEDDDPTVLGVLYFDVLTALFEGHKEKLDRGFDILPDSMEIY